MTKIKVMVVDDHPAYRAGLSRLLADEPDFEIVGTSEDRDEAVILASQIKPNVMIMDVSMPKLSGIEAAKQIKASIPEAAILIMSAFNYPAYVIAALRAGVSGYISKNISSEMLIKAVRLVSRGEEIFDRKITGSILRKLALNASSQKNDSEELHEREIQIVRLVARGSGNKQIAFQLNISKRTVQTHLANIYRKLKVSSRTEAVFKGLKKGLLMLDDLVDQADARKE